MTINDLCDKYNWKETIEEIKDRVKNGQLLHPTYERHLPCAWIIQDIWGHVQNENCSLGKARELTTAVMEEHIQSLEPEYSQTAYEFYNKDTGHAYVDYVPKLGMGKADGYTSTPLYKKDS